MKIITDKTVTIKGQQTNYKELLKGCIDNIPKEGLIPSDMAKRVKIINVINESNGEIKLEDTDFLLLKELVKTSRWTVVSPEIVEFSEYINKIS